MINSNFKVVLKAKQAAWLKPDAEAGEAIVTKELSKAALIEIAKANKFKIDSGLHKNDYFEILINNIYKMEGISIMSEQPITQQIDELVTNGFAAGQSKWVIIANMSEIENIDQAKLEAKYKESATRLGFEVDPKVIKANINEYLDSINIKEIPDYDTVTAIVDGIVENVENADNTIALSMLRKYAKSLFEGVADWKFPKKTKKSGGGKGGSAKSLFQTIPVWVKENQNATGDEVMEYLKDNVKSETRIKNMYLLVSGILAIFNPEFVPASPPAVVEDENEDEDEEATVAA